MSTKSELNYPGHISAQLRDGAWPGLKAIYFHTTKGYNKFFKEDPDKPGHGYIVVDAQPKPWLFGLIVGWSILYTNQQSPEDMEDMQLVTREVQFKLQAIRQKRAEAKAEAKLVEERAKEEVTRLANIGKKYEDRVAHLRTLPASDHVRKEIQVSLDRGDPEVMFMDKMDAYKAGYLQGIDKSKKELTAVRADLEAIKAKLAAGPEAKS